MAKTTYLKNLSNSLRQQNEAYKNSVPKLDDNSDIAELRNPLFTNELVYNTFYTGFTNMINKTVFQSDKIFRNPLEILKKNNNELGFDIREVASDLLKENKYELNDELLADFLKLDVPTTYQCIHRLNRQSYYKISISEAELELAFNSWDDLNNLFLKKAALLYNSNYVSEFDWSKNLLTNAVNDNKVARYIIDPVTDAATAEAAVLAIKDCATDFEFPSVENTGLYHITKGEQSIKVWTDPKDSVLVIPGKTMNRLDVKVLAVAFHLDPLKFNTDVVLKVDSLGYGFDYIETEDTTIDESKTYYQLQDDGTYEAYTFQQGETNPKELGLYEKYYYKIEFMLFDKFFTQIYDKKNQFWSGPVPSGMIEQRYLHVWQTFSVSPFCNARAFCSLIDESEIPANYKFNVQLEAKNDPEPNQINY